MKEPETKKLFIVTCDCSVTAEVSIYADDINEAREKLNSKDWSEFKTLDDYKVEDELFYEIDE